MKTSNSPFSWSRAGVDGLQIRYGGRPVSMVRGQVARSTLDRLTTASPSEAQRILSGIVAR